MSEDSDLRVGEIYGYRHFRDTRGQLRGINMSHYPFMPGINVAKCVHKPFRKRHKAPVGGCQCGIYGFYSDDIDVYSEGHEGPSGIIAAWGSVVSGDLGFRAEKAELVALVRRRPRRRSLARALGLSTSRFTPAYLLINANRRRDENLARKYDVPLFDTRDEAIAAFPVNDRPRFDETEVHAV